MVPPPAPSRRGERSILPRVWGEFKSPPISLVSALIAKLIPFSYNYLITMCIMVLQI